MVVDRTVTDTCRAEIVVEVQAYDSDGLRERFPDWDDLDDAARCAQLADVEPAATATGSNTTCVELHELLVNLLNGADPASGVADALALGTGTTQPAEGNTSLGNRVATADVTTWASEGTQLRTKTFVGRSVANGHDISEVGLLSGARLLNHSLLSTVIAKDSNTETTITAILSFGSA